MTSPEKGGNIKVLKRERERGGCFSGNVHVVVGYSSSSIQDPIRKYVLYPFEYL